MFSLTIFLFFFQFLKTVKPNSVVSHEPIEYTYANAYYFNNFCEKVLDAKFLGLVFNNRTTSFEDDARLKVIFWEIVLFLYYNKENKDKLVQMTSNDKKIDIIGVLAFENYLKNRSFEIFFKYILDRELENGKIFKNDEVRNYWFLYEKYFKELVEDSKNSLETGIVDGKLVYYVNGVLFHFDFAGFVNRTNRQPIEEGVFSPRNGDDESCHSSISYRTYKTATVLSFKPEPSNVDHNGVDDNNKGNNGNNDDGNNDDGKKRGKIKKLKGALVEISRGVFSSYKKVREAFSQFTDLTSAYVVSRSVHVVSSGENASAHVVSSSENAANVFNFLGIATVKKGSGSAIYSEQRAWPKNNISCVFLIFSSFSLIIFWFLIFILFLPQASVIRGTYAQAFFGRNATDPVGNYIETPAPTTIAPNITFAPNMTNLTFVPNSTFSLTSSVAPTTDPRTVLSFFTSQEPLSTDQIITLSSTFPQTPLTVLTTTFRPATAAPSYILTGAPTNSPNSNTAAPTDATQVVTVPATAVPTTNSPATAAPASTAVPTTAAPATPVPATPVPATTATSTPVPTTTKAPTTAAATTNAPTTAAPALKKSRTHSLSKPKSATISPSGKSISLKKTASVTVSSTLSQKSFTATKTKEKSASFSLTHNPTATHIISLTSSVSGSPDSTVTFLTFTGSEEKTATATPSYGSGTVSDSDSADATPSISPTQVIPPATPAPTTPVPTTTTAAATTTAAPTLAPTAVTCSQLDFSINGSVPVLKAYQLALGGNSRGVVISSDAEYAAFLANSPATCAATAYDAIFQVIPSCFGSDPDNPAGIGRMKSVMQFAKTNNICIVSFYWDGLGSVNQGKVNNGMAMTMASFQYGLTQVFGAIGVFPVCQVNVPTGVKSQNPAGTASQATIDKANSDMQACIGF